LLLLLFVISLCVDVTFCEEDDGAVNEQPEEINNGVVTANRTWTYTAVMGNYRHLFDILFLIVI